MAAAYVGTFGGAEENNFDLTLTWTTTRTINAGEHVVVTAVAFQDVASVTVGALSLVQDSAPSDGMTIWSARATAQITSGATVTVTLVSDSSLKAAVGEVLSGIATASWVRATAINSTGFGTSADTGTTDTTPVTGDLAIGSMYVSGDANIDISSVASPFTLGGDDGTDPWGRGITGCIQASYAVLASGGATSATYTLASGTDFGGAIVVYKAAAASGQLLSPSADSVDGAWTDQSGGTSLAAAIDETTASDSDYIRSELGPSNSACRVKLTAGGDPASSTGHIIHWRAGKDTTGGATIGMTVKLYQGGGNSVGGGTLIASFTRSNVDAFTTYDETLSGGEADSITNYGDLYLEFSANQT